MQERMKNPVAVFPEAMQALMALSKSADHGNVPRRTFHLVHLRASQINGCSVCVDMHWRMAKKDGDTEERLFAVGAWQDAPYFSDAERAALALTEAVTRLSDRTDPVPQALWEEVAGHYDEKGLAALLINIALINVWNRLNVPTKQVAGEWMKSPEARKAVEAATAAR